MANTTYGTDVERGSNQSGDTTTSLKNKVTDAAGKVKDKTEEIGRSVQHKIDEQRTTTADSMHSAAASIHETAETGSQKVRELAHGAADTLDATAGYIRDHDVQAMLGDVENVVRRFPGRSLLIAAGVGFLLGRAMRPGD